MIDIPVVQDPNAPTWTPPQVKTVRRRTRRVMIGDIPVGDGSPITVQTMTKTRTSDVQATLRQVEEAAEAGCDIVRITVNDKEAAAAMAEIVKGSPIPVVADIHFNHVFALDSIRAGVAKVRRQ